MKKIVFLLLLPFFAISQNTIGLPDIINYSKLSYNAGLQNCDVKQDKNGIVYAGEGCWGAPLRAADDQKPWTRDAGAVNQFNWIFVSSEKIELRTVLYENEDKIIELTYENRFTIPSGIEFFGPKNGTLIELFPRK